MAVSMSQPGAGSAFTDLTTRATAKADGMYLNGQKRWCSGAGQAEGYLVYCRMSDEAGARGIAAVYVEKGTPGLSFRKREELMGFRGIPSADMSFDDVRIPAENVVVRANGVRQLMEAFHLERCGNTTMCLALAQGALAFVLEYVQERRPFGKSIVDFQAVRIKLAEMAIKVEAARLLIYQAICNAAAGLPSVKESLIAKCFADEIAREVTGAAIQLMGGHGYSKEFPIERRFRDA